MKKLIRRINRFLFLDDERIKNQLNLYKLLENEDALSESENKAMLWYFKKVLKKELNKYVPINEMIDTLENKKTSEEV
ncbi:hypothetical protein [Empedobacter sp. GD03739]|uniref:hypothetical protein n=1 Tax=Empedobacter sp. GD03739 TaxID=2975376 RepID=UPI002449AEE7|nr:hypothetical protein [Empedobacter sp. GD03739]MDH1602319.1 hypothetical protein [Empedobacter sp. GD03739]